MDQQTIETVTRTWKDVEALGPAAGAIFYRNLFETDPSLRSLFQGDLEEQGKKLLQMMAIAVGNLRNADTLMPTLEALGRRHAGYGALPAHYATVGRALLTTLGQGLGDAFTEDVERAWTEVYGTISQVMIAASEEQLRLSA